MAFQTNSSMSKEDWARREKRELFCKAVNTMMMSDITIDIDRALSVAEKIIHTAFKNYPDNVEPVGEKLENIIQ